MTGHLFSTWKLYKSSLQGNLLRSKPNWITWDLLPGQEWVGSQSVKKGIQHNSPGISLVKVSLKQTGTAHKRTVLLLCSCYSFQWALDREDFQGNSAYGQLFLGFKMCVQNYGLEKRRVENMSPLLFDNALGTVGNSFSSNTFEYWSINILG